MQHEDRTAEDPYRTETEREERQLQKLIAAEVFEHQHALEEKYVKELNDNTDAPYLLSATKNDAAPGEKFNLSEDEPIPAPPPAWTPTIQLPRLARHSDHHYYLTC